MRSINVSQHFESERVFFQLNEHKTILPDRHVQLKLGNISVMNSIERDCSTEIGLRFNSLQGNRLTSWKLDSSLADEASLPTKNLWETLGKNTIQDNYGSECGRVVLSIITPRRGWKGPKSESPSHSSRGVGSDSGPWQRNPAKWEPLCKVFQNLWISSLYVFRSLRFADTNQRDWEDSFSGKAEWISKKSSKTQLYQGYIPRLVNLGSSP